MDNEKVADMLAEIGVLLELKGENPFKTRAYANAARTLETLDRPVADYVKENRLGELKGFGEALQNKITELVTTGRLQYYDDLRSSFPESLFTLLDIPGLGAKKVKVLYQELDIDNLDKLEMACQNNRIAQLSGFGQKSQQKILEGIAFRKNYASHHLVSEAWSRAETIYDALRAHPDVTRCSPAGSLRRHKEIIRDIDFVVSSKSPQSVITFFTEQSEVEQISAQGDTKASVILKGGIQVDLRVVQDVEFPFALAYFTGSKEHNIVMRQRAIQRGLRLNEYGLFRSQEETRDPDKRIRCHTEEEIFEQLGLGYIAPELREDQGEFDAAEQGELPRLLEWSQLRGSLHNHSNWSDGHQSLDEIAAHIDDLGCDYWAITDHSRSSFQANGLDAKRLRQQIKAVEETNQKIRDAGCGVRLLTGTEVDILNGDRLDFDDELLAELEVVVASIHQGFTQGEAELTRRLIFAAENPQVHMLGHLTGRLLLQREPYQVNQRAVIDACAETGTWIELNASPYRLDLDWRLWPYARSKGVKCVINCDAHRAEHASFLRLGAGIARKGWLTAHDVINTLPGPELNKALRKKRGR